MSVPGDPSDERVLRFAAAHDLVISSQIKRVLEADDEQSAARTRQLVDEGLLARAPRLRFQHGAYSITRAGLDWLGSEMPIPALNVTRYWRDLVLSWVWAGAQTGVFGEVDCVLSRREMRLADQTAPPTVEDELASPALRELMRDPSFALCLPDGRSRYPGVVLVAPYGRVALEWVGTPPSQRWVNEILDAYANKPQVRVAMLLVRDAGVHAALKAQVKRRGFAERVRVQKARFLFHAT